MSKELRKSLIELEDISAEDISEEIYARGNIFLGYYD